MLGPRSFRGLCAGLAATFLVPPNVLFAQEVPKAPPKAPQAQGEERALDVAVVDALDVEPRSGALLYGRTDLVVGEGDQAFRVHRSYRPGAGDLFNFGLDWVSVLDQHLDIHPSGERASFVDQDGQRVFFQRTKGKLVSVRGPLAVVEERADGYVITGLGDEQVYRFDKSGWLLSRSGPSLTVTYTYGARDRLLKVSGPWGDLLLKRDKIGALVALEAPDGRVVRYQRDEDGGLAKVTREGLFETYRYDGGGRLTSLADGQALVGYDAVGRVVRISGTGLRARTFSYVRLGGEMSQQTIITQGERTWSVAVSADGRKIFNTDAEGLKTVVHLDDRDRPVKLVTPDGLEHKRTFDAKGRLTESASPLGVTRYLYESDVTDRPTRITQPDGRWLKMAYDLRGKLTSVQTSAGAKTTYAYDSHGRLARKVDPRGAATTYSRDRTGQVVAVEEDGLGTTRFLRDEQGRLVKIQQPDGRVVSVSRSADGRTVRIADGRGPATERTYDTRGRVTRYQDGFGRVFNYTYAPEGELLSVSDELGKRLSLAYDASGQVVGITDGEGNETKIRRDGRQVVVTDPTQGERILRHDDGGRLIEEVRGGQKIGYAYDAIGRMVRRDTPGGAETFSYDANGRLTEMKGPGGALQLKFDDQGRLQGITDPALGKGVSYDYAPNGDRKSLQLPWGTVRYEHDLQGRITGIVLPDGGKIEIDLHADGRRKEIRYPNGVTTAFTYKRSRLNAVVTRKGEKVLDSRRYGYDKDGRVAWTEDAAGQRTSYAHDARGRLTQVKSDSETVTYRYDAMGNRTEEVRGAKTTASKIDEGNRVVRQGDRTFTYTATGAISHTQSSQGTTRYVYNHDDKLVEVKKADGTSVKYGYAPNGTRLWREGPEGKVRYLNDLSDVVAEVTGGGDVLASYIHGPGTDDVLAARRGDETFYYHYDLVRSVTSMTGKDGRVAARYDYDAFGAQRTAEGDAAAWNPFRYTSRSFDATSGLYDYRARTYDPTLGRFTTADPAGALGGLNLYAYVGNDPTLLNDPFGLWPEWLDSAAGWVGDRVSGATDWVVDTAAPAVWDGLKYVGRQSWAFTRGFGKGLYGAAKGLVNMVLHPIDTFNGIKHAIENWDETKEALLAMWEEYKDAAVNDPEKFAEMTGVLTAEIVFSLAGAKGLDKVAKVGTLGRAVASSSRVARVTAPVVNATTRTGSALARRFPRIANTVRNARVLSRARNIELARRAANPGAWYSRIPRRVATFGRDVWSGGRLAVTRPGAFVLYSGARLGRVAMGLVTATGRGLWKAGKWGTIPVLVAFEDNITDAIERSKTREEAMREVTKSGRALLNDAADLSPEELAVRIRGVGSAYRNYRNRLMKPIHDEDMRLDARLRELDEKVANGEIPPETIDSRLDAMLEEYGRRRLNLMADLYDRNRDADHDMLHPSPNRTISFQDEIDLLTAVKAKVTDPMAITLLDGRIADVTALMEHEYNLFRSGDHDDLIAGIAGVPRPVGEDPVDLDIEGLTYGDVDYMPSSGDDEQPTIIEDHR